MPNKTSDAGHVYLYAIIPGTEEKDLSVKGLFDSEVKILTEKGISAVVSKIMQKTDKLRPERKHLAAHQGVLTHLVENVGVVLPVSFGTIADSSRGVREMLSKYQKSFKEQISKVSGKVEMELKVLYEVPNVFEYFVEKYPDLKKVRDEIYKSNGEPDRDQKLELGRFFEQVQSEDRESLTAAIEKKLRSPCVEVKRNKPRNEKEVVRISCLMEKASVEEFQSTLDEVAGKIDGSLLFEYNGPLPPYNFVEVRVQL